MTSPSTILLPAYAQITTEPKAVRVNASAPGQPDFQDPFLRSWIDERLGSSEYRLLLMMQIHLKSEVDDHCSLQVLDAMTGQIEGRQGYVIRRRGYELIGVWGLQSSTIEDPDLAVAAAHAICNAVELHWHAKCVLHTQMVNVSKHEKQSAEDAIVISLARLPGDIHQSVNAPNPIHVSDAFLTLCGLNDSAPPINTVESTTRNETVALHALGSHWRTQSTTASTTSLLAHIARLDALADLKPLVQAAAIAGQPFTTELLARVFDLDPARLADAINMARALELIDVECHKTEPDQFVFCDNDLRQAAYDLVPPGDRLRLHRKAAAALRSPSNDCGAAAPVLVARHHMQARDSRQSKRWLSKAAWQAIAHGEADRAVTLLQDALSQDGEVENTTALSRALLQLLGVQLAITKGNGSDDVFDAYQQSITATHDARPLVWGQEFRSLWLAQSCHVVKGEVRAALTIGNLMLMRLKRETGRSESALGMHILTNRMHGLALMLSGQLAKSLTHYNFVIDAYRPDRHAILRFAYGSDQGVLAQAHKAWLHTVAGDQDAADAAGQRARRMADELEHPHTTAHAMSVMALAALSAGANDEALLAAREARAIASEHRFPYWAAWADVILAGVEAQTSPRTGSLSLERAMASYRATGAQQLCPFGYALLSSAALRDGRAPLALARADAGLAVASHSGANLYRLELLRCRALALFALGAADKAADALEAGHDAATETGALFLSRRMARDGLQHTRGQQQITWQTRYHASA